MKKIITVVFLLLLPFTILATELQTKILSDINTYRQQHSLNSLSLDSYLSKVAAQHSRNIATGSVPFGHAGFNERMHAVFAHSSFPRGIAENVAYTGNADLNVIVTSWLNSRGHRKNILGNFNLTGIGAAVDNQGGLYVTQIFLREG